MEQTGGKLAESQPSGQALHVCTHLPQNEHFQYLKMLIFYRGEPLRPPQKF